MRIFKIAGLILVGTLAITPVAFGHGFGGGGFHGGGGGFSGGGGHFAAGHSNGAHFGWYSGRFAPHDYGHGGRWYGSGWYGGPYDWGYPFGSDDHDYYDGAGAYDNTQVPDVDVTQSSSTMVAVQKALAKRGYYQGPIDGITGPQTEKALRSFQSANKLPVTGRVDSNTLRAFQIS